ncbi:hypothetical protein BON30_14590 [Cystobacter ferrugineus]|uniref:Uncharacterized protein n=2 Tax=Cystobacter ferrugineus TaxID=83449 RepID=A0A1L9BDH1_9BACT|nr:hypothetical protein BON30_14590 [Cystobacter ferrugineus]
MSLFEFEDFRWFPGGLRECLTHYITAMHRVLGTERILAPPPVARRILQDAFEKRQALCVLEISDNSQPRWLWWTAIPAGVLMVLLLTPFIRPLRLRQVLLTSC